MVQVVQAVSLAQEDLEDLVVLGALEDLGDLRYR